MPAFDLSEFLEKAGNGRKVASYRKKEVIFAQGAHCKGLYYVQSGQVKLSVLSRQGKEAIVALLGPADFFGEGCLAGQRQAVATATALADSRIMHIEQAVFKATLHTERAFSEVFMRYLLLRNIHFEEDLIDQLFNSSEKRLARVLLLMARYGKEGIPTPTIPKLSQETLAEIVGTTRAHINKFMNKFRKLGFINYDGAITVYPSLLSVVLHDGNPLSPPSSPPLSKLAPPSAPSLSRRKKSRM
jgi:CRP/FNR family transcriptional regulator, cyclic AMP receptor protein